MPGSESADGIVRYRPTRASRNSDEKHGSRHQLDVHVWPPVMTSSVGVPS